MRCKSLWKLTRWGTLIPAAVLFQSFGCLPNNALAQVLSENIVFTSAIAIQSVTALVFNALFGLA